MSCDALRGTLVVALEQAVAAPFCTSRLAEAGARIIKVEHAGGDFARAYDHAVRGESAYFVWLNRGKESVVLDLKDPADLALLVNMIARADVFIQNLAPGAAARAGLESEALRHLNPRLITCDISGYGDDGPMKDMKAYDLLIQCETGLASITGSPECPGRVGISIADIACGTYAHAGILQALLGRAQTGRGSGFSVSLFDAIADWMAVPLLHTQYGGAAPRRVGLAHPSIAPYGAFSTGDGRQIVFAVQTDREWRAFCRIVLLDESIAVDVRFVSNPARLAHRTDCDALVAARFESLTHSSAVALLAAARIGYSAVNTLPDLLQHPHLRRSRIGTPSGFVELVEPGIRWQGCGYRGGDVPALGEHDAALRREFA